MWEIESGVLYERNANVSQIFIIGDRVRCLHAYDGNSRIEGQCGAIVSIPDKPSENIGVCFDTWVAGHSCGGTCENGRGWYVPPAYLAMESDDAEFEPQPDEMWQDLLQGAFI